MKFIALVLLCFLVGCASKPEAVFGPKLVGRFCHSSIDAALCLDLKEDQTYSESFSGGGITVLGPNGEVPPAAVEPRGNGRWQERAGEVVLFPAQGSRRFLKIKEDGAAISLLESRNGKIIRTYRK